MSTAKLRGAIRAGRRTQSKALLIKPAKSRKGLLLGSSFAGGALMALGASVMMPSAAQAACSGTGTAFVTCSGTNITTYAATFNGSVVGTITAGSAWTGTNASGTSGFLNIDTTSGAANTAIELHVDSSSANHTTLNNTGTGLGIQLRSGVDGLINVNNIDADVTITSQNDALRLRTGSDGTALTGDGTITVTSNGVLHATNNGQGIDAQAGAGGVNINIAGGSVTSDLSDGIAVSAGGDGISEDGPGAWGDITVTTATGTTVASTSSTKGGTSGVLGGATTSSGILAFIGTSSTPTTGSDGIITVNASGTVTGGYGIVGYNTGSGAVSITTHGAVSGTGAAVSGAGGDGILGVAKAGGVTIKTYNTVTSAHGDGIQAQTSNLGNIKVTTFAAVSGDPGINSIGSGGTTDIDTFGTTTGTADGIRATEILGGTIDIDAWKNVTGGSGIGGNGNGIFASSEDGDIDIGVHNWHGLTTIQASGANGNGINATTTGEGGITIGTDFWTSIGASGAGNAVDQTGILASLTGSDSATDTGIAIYQAGKIYAEKDGIAASIASGNSRNILINSFADVDSNTDDGIQAVTAGNGNITVNAFADVTAGNGGGDAGIQANTTGDGDVNVTVHLASDINATADGIDATSTGEGDIDISLWGDITTTELDGNGIHARSLTGGTGAIDINTWWTSDINTEGDGIDASIANIASLANITINAGGVITSATDDGIQAENYGDGDITINTYGDVTAGNGGGDAGIQANAYGDGDVNVTVHVASDINASEDGIDATSSGEGDIDVTVWGDITSEDVDGNGIHARSLAGGTGAIDINTWWTSDINAEGDGIDASIADAANSSAITIDAGGNITSYTDDGIQAETYGNGAITINTWGDIDAGNGAGDAGIQANARGDGAVNVTVHGASDITATENGIDATSEGEGDINVTLWGDITTNEGGSGIIADNGILARSLAGGTGAITINTWWPSDIYTQGDGIDASIVNSESDANITINARGDITSNTDDGIVAANAGTGNVAVTVWGDIEAGNNGGDAGIEAAATNGGNVTVTTHGFSDITGHDHGIDARAIGGLGAGTVTLDLWGDVDAVDTNGTEILVTTTADTLLGRASITNHWTGDINGYGTASQLAISGAGGATSILNYGDVTGRVSLLGYSADGGDEDADQDGNIFTNRGTWYTLGTNDFGATGDSLIQNDGHIYTAFGDDNETTTFTVDQFNNDAPATIGVLSMEDGDATDHDIITGNFQGSLSEGGTSLIVLDAWLASAESEDAAGDLLTIDGNVSGTTGLVVYNVNPSPPSDGPNLTPGIHVIHVGGDLIGDRACDSSTDAACKDGDAFFIADATPGYENIDGFGTIRDGLYTWILQQRPGESESEDFYLVSQASPDGANQASQASTLTTAWFDTAGYVDDHDYGSQLEDQSGGADPATAPAMNSVLWGRINGSWSTRDTTVVDGGIPIDTSASQNTYGITAGLELRPNGGDNNMRLGLYGGYVASNTGFAAYDGSSKATGGTVGAYLAVANGSGWYADGEVKGDFVALTYTSPFVTIDTTGNTIGLIANTGYRMENGKSFFEPIASFAYARTTIAGATVGTTTVSYSDGNSIRAGLGARVGTTIGAPGAAQTELDLTGKVWDEFGAANSVTVDDTAAPNPVTVTDDIAGIFGEVVGRATVFNAARTASGFVSVGGKFGATFSSVTAKAGLRKSF